MLLKTYGILSAGGRTEKREKLKPRKVSTFIELVTLLPAEYSTVCS